MVVLQDDPRLDLDARVTEPARAPEAPPTNRRMLFVLVALLAILAAFGATRLLGGGGGDATETAPATPTTTAPAPGAVAQDQLTAEIATLSKFVEKERGLTFKAPVKATVIDDAEFRKSIRDAMGELDDAAKAKLEQDEMVMKAFGLLTADADLVAMAQSEALELMIAGWYDPDTKQLFVRGATITPFVRQVVVHELTHALDDQNFGLQGPEAVVGSSDSEPSDALRALVEGSAMRVEEAFTASMTPQDRAAAEREEAEQVARIPTAPSQPIDYYFAFPYVDGPEFVKEILEKGGQERLDKAFREPPQTTAEIIEPVRFLLGLHGAQITDPKAEGPIVDRGDLGELPLFLAVNSALGADDAMVAAVSWEAGRYVAWKSGDRMCVRARFLLDAPWTTELTAKVLEAWAAKQVDASVEAPGTVVLTSCR